MAVILAARTVVAFSLVPSTGMTPTDIPAFKPESSILSSVNGNGGVGGGLPAGAVDVASGYLLWKSFTSFCQAAGSFCVCSVIVVEASAVMVTSCGSFPSGMSARIVIVPFPMETIGPLT